MDAIEHDDQNEREVIIIVSGIFRDSKYLAISASGPFYVVNKHKTNRSIT